MNLLIRWAKFNLVGVIGMAVQLAALGLFNRCFHGHYLVASAAAVELTLLHNFTWHMLYTWRDRPTAGGTFDRLLRFHLSNGLVSMLGNLALMRLLVSQAHMPLRAANIIAILSCSIINFLLSDAWAFHCSSPPSPSKMEQAPSPPAPTGCPSLAAPKLQHPATDQRSWQGGVSIAPGAPGE